MLKATTQHQKTQTVSPFVANISCALIVGVIITFITLLFFSWIFLQVNLPAWSAIPLSATAVCLGSFFSGYILARRTGQNGLFCGLCFGIFYFLLYLCAALLNGQFDYTALSSIKLVCYVLSGCIGGFIGVVKSEQTAKRKRLH